MGHTAPADRARGRRCGGAIGYRRGCGGGRQLDGLLEVFEEAARVVTAPIGYGSVRVYSYYEICNPKQGLQTRPSTMSLVNLWGEACELYAGILGGKLPVHTLVTRLASLLPCPRFMVQCLNIWNPPIKALASEGTQRNFGHSEPAAVFGCRVDSNLWTNSRAFSDGNASESEPIPCVLRLSHTKRTRSASG